MSVLKVGLIGCGRIAQLVHLNVLRNLPGVELAALAELDPQRRAEASQRAPGAMSVADYQELLAMPEVEAVVICLPNALHVEAAVAAFEQGKHVYLEKPLATNLPEAQSVLTAWRRAGAVGMIGFNFRFNPLYQALKQRLQSNRIGELISARSVFSTAAHSRPQWKHTRQSGGGVLLDLASHHVDLVHFLFDQPVGEVAATVRSQQSEDDSALLQLRLADGLLVQSFFSMSAIEEDRFEIYGQAGKLAVERYSSVDVEITEPAAAFARFKRWGRHLTSLLRSRYILKKLLAPSHEPSYQAALAHFVAATQGRHPARPDLQDGYRSLAVIEAAEESARTGRIVSLDEPVNEVSS